MNRLPRGLLILACLAVWGRDATAGCRPLGSFGTELSAYGALTVVPPVDEAIRPPDGWTTLGGRPDGAGCFSFGPQRSAVFVQAADVVSRSVSLEIDHGFDLRLIMPKDSAARLEVTARQLAEAVSSTRTFFPLGFAREKSAPFFVLAGFTASNDGSILRYVTGDDIAVLTVPVFYGHFLEDAVRVATRIFFTKGHPEAGPESRRLALARKLDPSATEVISYGAYRALAEAWIVVDRLGNTPRRLHLAQHISATVPVARPSQPGMEGVVVQPTTGQAFVNGVDWLEELAGAAGVKPTGGRPSARNRLETYLTGGYGLMAAAHLAQRIREEERRTLSDVLVELHGQRQTSSERFLRRDWLEPVLPSFSDLLDEGRSRDLRETVLTEMIRVDSPGWQRAPNLEIVSGPAVLDARFYRGAVSPSETAFLVTHGMFSGQAPIVAYDALAAPLVDRLLAKGDVLVVHRSTAGRTIGGLSEFSGSCEDPDYLGPAQNGARHIADAARWLHLKGYRNLIVLAPWNGAFAALASGPELPPGARLVLVDPIQGIRRDRSGLCDRQDLERLVGLLKADNKVPTLVLLNDDLRKSKRLSLQAVERFWQTAFPEAKRVTLPDWVRREGLYFELAPEIWINHLEAFLP